MGDRPVVAARQPHPVGEFDLGQRSPADRLTQRPARSAGVRSGDPTTAPLGAGDAGRGSDASDSAAPDSDSTTFFLIGDTGEQDASQYVVAPALSRAVAEHNPAFVMIMSDVIYPAGDVDDYPDGVYRPYRGDDRQFRVTAPLLGLPGNHDWYDGLAGFMYHFTTRAGQPTPTPPNAAYAPAQDQRSTVSRLCRILWRRPSEPARADQSPAQTRSADRRASTSPDPTTSSALPS